MRVPENLMPVVCQAIFTKTGLRDFQVFLFGSRTHDHLKGGDIDLLIYISTKAELNRLIEKKLDILVEIKKYLGDRKIDLLWTSRDENPSQFIQAISAEAQLLGNGSHFIK